MVDNDWNNLSFDEKLNKLRQSIDDIDEKILDLLNQRAKVAQEVGKIKNHHDTDFYIPSREKAIMKRLREKSAGPLPREAIESVFREVISACRALETNLHIAYLGPAGSYHHCAAQAHFGRSPEFIPTETIRGVFHEVECRRVEYGVVAIENSIEGSVGQTLDYLAHSNNHVVGEIYFPISHNLISQSELHDIERVYAHPQALAQCRNWLESNLPNAQQIDASSNTAGVMRCQDEPRSAAIASRVAAEMFDIPIQVYGIEDFAGNTTRFFVIGSEPMPPSGDDKTSMVVFLRDQVGALYSMLEPFKKHSISLTNIVSRPTKQEAWQYMFFLECKGHIEDKSLKKAMDDIKDSSLYLKILGSYPHAHVVKKDLMSNLA